MITVNNNIFANNQYWWVNESIRDYNYRNAFWKAVVSVYS